MKALLLAALVFATMLWGCSPEPTAEIAATTLPVYQFTLRLCQDTGIRVTRLVTESVSCLHDYSLNVSQVRAAEGAQVIVQSGMGLEDFMADILADGQIIDSSAGIEPVHCHHDDHGHAGHNHEQDPHIWLSPEKAKTMADNICQGLCKYFPEHRDTFQMNLSGLLADLDALQAYGEQQLAQLSCRELITFHDGFAYYAEAFDLHLVKAIEEESGSEASAQELIELIELVRTHDLPAIFTECNGSVSAADIIARETGASVYSLDMAMAGDDYFTAMRRNIDTIKEALG
ncbi:MAG: zinc ABC transporter substrate-binding protein [Ruminococcaceae bacterium]|nr:zinc ABC transporter substrate-binding protein [Oscillospiraceae bacterium]MBQ3216152.1 zinc ABC transporter substrate-binding protein [Oscillospiraceae bacterium]